MDWMLQLLERPARLGFGSVPIERDCRRSAGMACSPPLLYRCPGIRDRFDRLVSGQDLGPGDRRVVFVAVAEPTASSADESDDVYRP